jgi:hypothetical protein
MEADIAEVNVHACLVQFEQGTGGITCVQSGLSLTRGGHGNGGPGSNWVKPWLKTTNSSACPYHCDGFDYEWSRSPF